jgi:hypothetical protein
MNIIFDEKDEIHFSEEYVGNSGAFGDDGLVVFASRRQEGSPSYLGISWNGEHHIYEVTTNSPILVEYLKPFQIYPHEVRQYIQSIIYSDHGPTCDFLHEHFEETNRILNFISRQSFSSCSNAAMKIKSDNRFFFAAVTGPSREWSEGIVCGISDRNMTDLVRLPAYLKPSKPYFSRIHSESTMKDYIAFLEGIDNLE